MSVQSALNIINIINNNITTATTTKKLSFTNRSINPIFILYKDIIKN